MSDGTVLNAGVGGDTVATEDIQPGAVGDSRVVLPVGGQKLPRSKVAVGLVDRDEGDATDVFPLPTGDRRVRQLAEQQMVRDANTWTASLAARAPARERVTLLDRRGSDGSRGVTR